MSSPSSDSTSSKSPSSSSPPSSPEILLKGKPIVILKKPVEFSGPSDVNSSEDSSTSEDSMNSSKGSLIVGETSSETFELSLDSCAISETSYDSDVDDNGADLFNLREPSSISEVYDSRINYSSDEDDLAMNYPQPELIPIAHSTVAHFGPASSGVQDASSTVSNRLKVDKNSVVAKR